MTTELLMLAWTLVLALFQIALAAAFRTAEVGLTYSMGARDEPARAPGKITARLQRAQANLFETLPVFAAAVLLIGLTHHESTLSYWGSMLYLGARVLYLPMYALGVHVLRTLVWTASLIGLVMLLTAILTPS